MDKSGYIVDCIKNNVSLIYSKYGDGEYICMNKNYYYFGFF